MSLTMPLYCAIDLNTLVWDDEYGICNVYLFICQPKQVVTIIYNILYLSTY